LAQVHYLGLLGFYVWRRPAKGPVRVAHGDVAGVLDEAVEEEAGEVFGFLVLEVLTASPGE